MLRKLPFLYLLLSLFNINALRSQDFGDSTNVGIVFDQDSTDKAAEYPDGENAMFRFLAKNIKYPPTARNKGITGRVVLKIVVEIDGSFSDIEVVKSVGGGCDEESVRVAKLLPKFIPAEKDGKLVRSYFMLPIFYNLAGGSNQRRKQRRN